MLECVVIPRPSPSRVAAHPSVDTEAPQESASTRTATNGPASCGAQVTLKAGEGDQTPVTTTILQRAGTACTMGLFRGSGEIFRYFLRRGVVNINSHE